MKILIALNYYYPYISGVSEVARIVAENWVKEGHKVMVVTSNHDNFPKQEVINGVTVLRTPVILKISKGVISPQFITQVIKLSKEYDVVNLHLPMIESGIIAPWIEKDKILVTYHCDVNLPNNWLNYIIVNMMDFSNRICMERAKKITVTTLDYAEHSRVANDFMDKLMETAAPPKDFKRKDESLEEKQKKIIGFCGRIVQEKGIDVLLKAYSILKQEELDVCLKIGGDYKKIAGGSVYESLRKYIQENKIEDVEFLGMIPNDKMEKFYSSLDVFKLFRSIWDCSNRSNAVWNTGCCI